MTEIRQSGLIPPGDYVIDRAGTILEGPYKGKRVILPRGLRLNVIIDQETDDAIVPETGGTTMHTTTPLAGNTCQANESKFFNYSTAGLWQALAARRAMLARVRQSPFRRSEWSIAHSIMEIEAELQRRGEL